MSGLHVLNYITWSARQQCNILPKILQIMLNVRTIASFCEQEIMRKAFRMTDSQSGKEHTEKKAHPVEPDAPKQGEACVFTEVRQSCGLFCHTCG